MTDDIGPIYGEGSGSSPRSASTSPAPADPGTSNPNRSRGVSQSVPANSTYGLTPLPSGTAGSTGEGPAPRGTLHENVTEWLTDRGICSMDRDKRAELATRLVGEGISMDALEFIGETIERRTLSAGKTLDQVASFIGKALHAPLLWQAYVEDTERFEDWRREREAEEQAPVYRDRNWMPPAAKEPDWEHQERCRRIWCVLIYDRKPIGELSAAEKLTPDRIVELAREGMLLSGVSEKQGEHDLRMVTDEVYRRKVMDEKIRDMRRKKAAAKPSIAPERKDLVWRVGDVDKRRRTLIVEMRRAGRHIVEIEDETGVATPVVLEILDEGTATHNLEGPPDA